MFHTYVYMHLYVDAKLMIIYVLRTVINCFWPGVAQWGRMASQVRINSGSSNGLSHDRPKDITWNNADLISIGPSRTYLWDNMFF